MNGWPSPRLMYARPGTSGWVLAQRMSGTGSDRLLVQPARAVGRAHQRPGHDPGETDLLGLLAQLDELVGLDPPGHRVVLGGGPQVLRDRDELAAGVVEILQRLADLVALLAHAQDQVRLGDQAVGAGRADDIQRPLVAEARTDRLE